jgi:ADP-ribosylglycohydrolase
VAIGDALGAPFEHLGPGQKNQAIERMGGSIRDFVPYQNYPAGTWTDDTGLTLATCRALIMSDGGGAQIEDCLKREFFRWAGSDECRRPGRTVLYAATTGKRDENSWANGALMRIAPVGLYCSMAGLDRWDSAELAVVASRVTHGHIMAFLPAVECVLAIRSIMEGDRRVPEDLAFAIKYIPFEIADKYWERLEDYINARTGDCDSVHPSTGLWMWRHVFERCLQMKDGRLWERMPPFEEGLVRTLDNSFDKDTAGAVAGGLLGAYWGEDSIPSRWKEGLEKAGRIVELADRLVDTMAEKRGKDWR